MADLFYKTPKIPLAEQLRPRFLKDIVGQNNLLGEEGSLSQYLKNRHLPSLILWGPPGCGKTSLARLLAQEIEAEFIEVSAIFSGIAGLKKVFDQARSFLNSGRSTLLFVDEVHRFNRAQQDAFLPHVESGLVTLVGATTENPSFELNGALLSRCQVMVLNPLEADSFGILKTRAETFLKYEFNLILEAEDYLYGMAEGDGRYFLALLESLYESTPKKPITIEYLKKAFQKRAPLYDKNKEQHYNLVSVLHKSIRGSDVDAALYWLGRMLEGGEDPLYLFRRLIRMACEDIGMADPQALPFVIASTKAYERLGSPEGKLSLAQAVIYLATAPKSNATYIAFNRVCKTVKDTSHYSPPEYSLNAPTSLMKTLGYGKGYQYDPDTKEGFSGQNYFPEKMNREKFYTPVGKGFEKEIKERLFYWERLRKDKDSLKK